MYNKILCIFPEDQTTDFLFPIQDAIQKKFGAKFELHRICNTQDSYEKALYKMQNYPDNSLIIYLGHGSSIGFQCIQNSEDSEIDYCVFLSSQNIQRLAGKSLYALSCNSASFLKMHQSKSNLKLCLGFGDLPTENENFNIDSDYRLTLLESYKQLLVESSIASINELISTKSAEKAHSILKLYFNKMMISFAANNKIIGNKAIAELIYRTKKEIFIYQ